MDYGGNLVLLLREQLAGQIAVGDLHRGLQRIKADGKAVLHAEAIDHALVEIAQRPGLRR